MSNNEAFERLIEDCNRWYPDAEDVRKENEVVSQGITIERIETVIICVPETLMDVIRSLEANRGKRGKT